MINTFNESKLHKTLKTYYSQQNKGSQTEVKVDKFIADIRTKDGDIIEIQTANLGSLKEKIQYCMNDKINLKIVFPLVTTKYIKTISESNEIISCRKSPVHKNIYSIFKELTSIHEFLLHDSFTLEVLEITMTEIRLSTKEPVQSKNNKRRFMKNWIKQDKILEEIGKSYTFSKKTSYANLFPSDLPDRFTIKDLKQALSKEKLGINIQTLRYFIWVCKKMDIIEHCDTINRNHVYRLK